jgi:hypothetical protein
MIFSLSKLPFKYEMYLRIFRFQNKKQSPLLFGSQANHLENPRSLLVSKILGVLGNSFLSTRDFSIMK